MNISKNFISIAVLLNLGMLFVSIYGMLINIDISKTRFVASLFASLIFSSLLIMLFLRKKKE